MKKPIKVTISSRKDWLKREDLTFKTEKDLLDWMENKYGKWLLEFQDDGSLLLLIDDWVGR